MIRITQKNNCCGCSACASICPRACITMRSDSEGFAYPKVDETKCIECGMCETVCPLISKSKSIEGDSKGYIAYSKNEKERLNSSSGGVFYEIAKKVILSGGVVFGAAFNEHHLVNHVMVDKIDDLSLLQGSKYLQSSIGNAYRDVESYLKDDREVLFVGTACQVAGLKGFLRKDYKKLITVDVLCHGVPSPKVWAKYLEEISHNRKIISISFRDKETGWKNYSVNIQYDNGTSEKMKYWDNIYMRLFLENLSLRPSCYVCKYKGIPRESDITLGDCWGVENHSPEMDDNKGTSIVLVHSEIGASFLSSIICELKVKEMDIDTVLPVSSDSRKPVSMHRKREQFFNEIDSVESLEEFRKWLNPGLKSRIKTIIKQVVRPAKHK